jgi:predicted nuclease with TOPRIM domain
LASRNSESDVMKEVVKRVNEDRRRVRIIERNISRLESTISSLEESVLSQMGELKITLDRINNKMSLATEKLGILESEILRLKKQIGKGATKVELKQLESFIDLVNPVTSKFVTKDELERALDERLRKKI